MPSSSCSSVTSVIYGALLLTMMSSLVIKVDAVCPHCSGNFNLCDYAVDGSCPTLTMVAANAKVVTDGVGALKLEHIKAEFSVAKAFAKPKSVVTYMGKFYPKCRPCKAFNEGGVCTDLYPDGTCKYNLVCDHWMSNKGKDGRCLCPDHARFRCTNPERCDEPVA